MPVNRKKTRPEVKAEPLTVDEVTLIALLGVSRDTLRESIETEPEFPKAIYYTPRCKRWYFDEVRAYVRQKHKLAQTA